MKLTTAVKLQPTTEQVDALCQTVLAVNRAANETSRRAWEAGTFAQFKLHRLAYADIRATSGLSAQVVVRLIAKVADAYKLDRDTIRHFRSLGSIAYDDRILSWQAETVSIWTVAGRQRISFVCTNRARELLRARRGETDLVLRNGKWFLYAVVDVPELKSAAVTDVLGVDLGVVNIAADSDGTIYAGGHINGLRTRAARLRSRLQSRGTRSAKRRLRAHRLKESRFARDVNHRISKQLVATAQGTGRGIALEDLKGIRERVTARRSQRRRLSSWAFFDLRQKVAYKARLVGVPVVLVDPRYTSQGCPVCGHISRANRPTRGSFACIECGFSGHADTVAATNIALRGRALVNDPNVSEHRVRLPA